MPLGPGKYDELCTYVREQSHAEAAVVIILNGNRGAGFSVQASAEVLAVLSDLLRSTAKQIESSFGQS
jgi:hypothetical protein